MVNPVRPYRYLLTRLNLEKLWVLAGLKKLRKEV
jgi:hypothetical protein